MRHIWIIGVVAFVATVIVDWSVPMKAGTSPDTNTSSSMSLATELAQEDLGMGLKLGAKMSVEELKKQLTPTGSAWQGDEHYWWRDNTTTCTYYSPVNPILISGKLDESSKLISFGFGVRVGAYLADAYPESPVTMARLCGPFLRMRTRRGCTLGQSLCDLVRAYGIPQVNHSIPLLERDVIYTEKDYQISFWMTDDTVVDISVAERPFPWVIPDRTQDQTIQPGILDLGVLPRDAYDPDRVMRLLTETGLLLAHEDRSRLWRQHDFHVGDGGLRLKIVAEHSDPSPITGISLSGDPMSYRESGKDEMADKVFALKTTREGVKRPSSFDTKESHKEYMMSTMRSAAEKRLIFAKFIGANNPYVYAIGTVRIGSSVEDILQNCGQPSLITQSPTGFTDIYLYVGSKNTLCFHLVEGTVVNIGMYMTTQGHTLPPIGFAP